ncbi:helix-turn-helix transcriptional regulator [Rhizobium sp. 18055]|uniref:helix-turn-helix domain-containing protein n=1 Tax=Rhizobium sp. 18055 TaxID=2681403 RepID=UPI001356964B|nr:helix-turn-helix transcriptional regulator [Rhizobium sp. 18055]
MEDPEELAFKERIRDVIQANGKAPLLAKKTGIPLGTLNKYVAMRSIPSVTNAAKIAAAVGVSLEYLATGLKVISPDNGTGWEGVEDRMALEIRPAGTSELYERLFIAVERAYKDAKQTAPSHRIARATGEVMDALRERVGDIRDQRVVDAVIPIVLEDLSNTLLEAQEKPGSGKRTA